MYVCTYTSIAFVMYVNGNHFNITKSVLEIVSKICPTQMSEQNQK